MAKWQSMIEKNTDAHQMLKFFEDSKQSFFDLIEKASEAVYFHDIEGTLIFLNSKAEQLTGYSREDLINKNMSAIFDDNALSLISAKLKQEGKKTDEKLELSLLAKDGKRVPVELSLTPVKGSKKLIGYGVIVRDLSERKHDLEVFEKRDAKIHQIILQIQKKYMKLEESARIQSEFVSKISHEFRTPLNGIVGYAELLEDKVYGNLNSNQLAALENIKSCALDLLKMVQEVLDLSRPKTNQLKLEYDFCTPRELVEAVGDTVGPIAKTKGLKFEVSFAEDLPTIRVDFKRIYQVLVNLVSNSVKFTKEGVVQVGAEWEENAVKFSVKDTGVGISSELKELIFHEFRIENGTMNRFYGGMGLALSLSRRLVELHDGKLWAESRTPQGCSFYFTIPLETQKN